MTKDEMQDELHALAREVEWLKETLAMEKQSFLASEAGRTALQAFIVKLKNELFRVVRERDEARDELERIEALLPKAGDL